MYLVPPDFGEGELQMCGGCNFPHPSLVPMCCVNGARIPVTDERSVSLHENLGLTMPEKIR